MYEASSGALLCRASCGEITTAMCFSSNMKHLITASADGVIYIWKIPESINKALVKVVTEMKTKEKLEKDIIKEAEMEDEYANDSFVDIKDEPEEVMSKA
jgi:WD40 repeat protein